MKKMTMRDRMLGVVQGRTHDRAPFVQYSAVAGFPPDEDVEALLGHGNIGWLRWTGVHRIETPNCRWEIEPIHVRGLDGHRRTLNTPAGTLQEERLFDPVLNSSAATSHFIKKPDDYHVLMAYLKDVTVVQDPAALRETHRDLAETGLPHVYIPRTPYQQLWVEWVDIQDLAPHLYELPDLMEEVFSLMEKIQRRVFEEVCAVARNEDVPYVVFADNITAPMIGELYFRRYCVTAYDELAGMLDETGKDIPVFVHMDGDLKPLWKAIGASRVRGLDSMSPPPDNDTRVCDALEQWPDMRVLLNFPSSVHLADEGVIHDTARAILEEGGRKGRLQIQISENVPPDRWRTSYPIIARAIEDFGPACSS